MFAYCRWLKHEDGMTNAYSFNLGINHVPVYMSAFEESNIRNAGELRPHLGFSSIFWGDI